MIRAVSGNNIWLNSGMNTLADFPVKPISYNVLESENTVGQAMLTEIQTAAVAKTGDLVIVILGGRGAQALHRLLGEKAQTTEIDDLLARLHIFTQDALAPLAMDNSLSFVRDFERLFGADFLAKVKSFNSMQTATADPEAELIKYSEKLETSGIDIFFLGFGPEAEAASHLCYIKPNSGATVNAFAGIIPISNSILEHHIAKFKAGGSEISAADEAECRAATHILTLGPAAILRAQRVVQSIVDASTAPAKRDCYKRLRETEFAKDETERARQLDENPGLWLRLHPNAGSLILKDVLETQ